MHTAKTLPWSDSSFYQLFRFRSLLISFVSSQQQFVPTSQGLYSFPTQRTQVVQNLCHRTDTGQIHEVLLPQIQTGITERLSHLKENCNKRISLEALRRNTELCFYNQHVQWSGSTTETADPVTKLNQLGFQSYAHFLKREKLISFKLKSSFFHITVVVEIHTFACHYQVTSWISNDITRSPPSISLEGFRNPCWSNTNSLEFISQQQQWKL